MSKLTHRKNLCKVRIMKSKSSPQSSATSQKKSSPLRILGLCGSLRKDSYNGILLKEALSVAKSTSAHLTSFSLFDAQLPLFNEDSETKDIKSSGVKSLREAFKSHDCFFIASPEYNGSLSAALKNAIDWGSRQHGNERILECFEGKSVFLLSASPGNLGGARVLPHLRVIMAQLKTHVFCDQVNVARAHEVFNNNSKWNDQKQRDALCKTTLKAIQFANMLRLER